MACNANDDIRSVISTFELFLSIYENQSYLLHARSNEEIKNAFKIAIFIEQSVHRFNSENTIARWMNILQKHLQENSNGKAVFFEFSGEFFSVACDHLLAKFFEFKSTDINMIDISVRMYTSLLPITRFKKFVSNLLLKSSSYKAILDFVLINSTVNSRELEYQLVLNKWTEQFLCGKTDEVILSINEILRFTKVEKSLHLLTGILAIESSTVVQQNVKDTILEIILQKMLGRSVLSKSFWISLFKIEGSNLLKICDFSEDFLGALCNFMIYIGSMMEIDNSDGKNKWISNPNISICPELSYSDLLTMVKVLSSDNFDKKQFTLSKIRQAEVDTGSNLWVQIMYDINSFKVK